MRERFGICKLCPDSAKYFNTKALVLCLKKKKKNQPSAVLLQVFSCLVRYLLFED